MASVTTPMDAQAIAATLTEQLGRPDLISDSAPMWWNGIARSSLTMNQYFETLVDVIISQKIISKSFTNPLARFKNSTLPLGFGESEMYFNPQTGRYFAVNVETAYPGETIATTKNDGVGETNQSLNQNAHILVDKVPDIKQVFYKVNYGRQYQRTYSALELQKVATSWESYASFIDGVARDINASANIDEFKAMKDLFTNGVTNALIPQLPIQAVTDEATAKALLVEARTLYGAFQFPSEDYNGWNMTHAEGDKITTWTEPGAVSIALTNRSNAVIDVQALAAAFNMDKADFIGKKFVVDKLDADGEIQAIIFDDALVHVTDVFSQTGQIYNPATAKENIFLNKQAIMALCPFANAVAITTATFTVVSTKPNDWATKYNDYYVKNSAGLYIAVQGVVDAETGAVTAPNFDDLEVYSKS